LAAQQVISTSLSEAAGNFCKTSPVFIVGLYSDVFFKWERNSKRINININIPSKRISQEHSYNQKVLENNKYAGVML